MLSYSSLHSHFTHTSCRAKVLEFHHSAVFGTERQVITTATAMCQDETQPFGFLLADFLFSSSHVFTVSPFACTFPVQSSPRRRRGDREADSTTRTSKVTNGAVQQPCQRLAPSHALFVSSHQWLTSSHKAESGTLAVLWRV